jgi:peptidylprolyl isomerase
VQILYAKRGKKSFQTGYSMPMKSIAVALFLVLGVAGPVTVAANAGPAAAQGHLQIIDVKRGTGAVAKAGQSVTVHYTGWLYEHGAKGKKFDSSVDRGTPFSFVLGAGNVIPGWDQGVAGMKVGGKRTLIIPPDLGYGADGTPDGTIPPGATLIFDVELLQVH